MHTLTNLFPSRERAGFFCLGAPKGFFLLSLPSSTYSDGKWQADVDKQIKTKGVKKEASIFLLHFTHQALDLKARTLEKRGEISNMLRFLLKVRRCISSLGGDERVVASLHFSEIDGESPFFVLAKCFFFFSRVFFSREEKGEKFLSKAMSWNGTVRRFRLFLSLSLSHNSGQKNLLSQTWILLSFPPQKCIWYIYF